MINDLWMFRCSVIRVIDGDTVIVEADLGFRTRSEQSIRLAGYNAPELHGRSAKNGIQARTEMRAWVTQHISCAVDPKFAFMLRTRKDELSFNRYIGELSCDKGHIANNDVGSKYPKMDDK